MFSLFIYESIIKDQNGISMEMTEYFVKNVVLTDSGGLVNKTFVDYLRNCRKIVPNITDFVGNFVLISKFKKKID